MLPYILLPGLVPSKVIAVEGDHCWQKQTRRKCGNTKYKLSIQHILPCIWYIATTQESGMPQSGDRRCAVNAIQLHCTLVK